MRPISPRLNTILMKLDVPTGDRPEVIATLIPLIQEAIRLVEAGEGDRVLWAMLHLRLGAAYLMSINSQGGSRGENVEAALPPLQKALTIFTRQSHPEQWALIQMNLAQVYTLRFKGTESERIPIAIAAYRQALTVFTEHAHSDFYWRCKRMILELENRLEFGKMIEGEDF